MKVDSEIQRKILLDLISGVVFQGNIEQITETAKQVNDLKISIITAELDITDRG